MLFVELLHVVPLFVIMVLLSIPVARRLFAKKAMQLSWIEPSLLFLSAIGVASGTLAHHHNVLLHVIDPCFGYAVVLMALAFKTHRDTRVKALKA